MVLLVPNRCPSIRLLFPLGNFFGFFSFLVRDTSYGLTTSHRSLVWPMGRFHLVGPLFACVALSLTCFHIGSQLLWIRPTHNHPDCY
ncbi:hypothetical protein GGS20DRAFT_572884 [Poronia punctata]|nr:hypothetical protein GGS20DRAFT_572884 [Poronia punctata]